MVGQKVTAQVLRNGKLTALEGTVQPRPPFKKPNHVQEALEVPFREGYVRAYLTYPQGEGSFPTIYYIQGYPCQSINSHPQHPTVQLTASLVDLGYAVFRIEKLGVGEFTNLSSCMDYSFDDEVENFKGGLAFLQKLKQVDASKIYLFGHSLGGNVAPILAKDAKLAGVMVFGTIVKPWEDYLLDMAYYSQTHAQDPLEVAANIPLLKAANRKLYREHLSHIQLTEEEKSLLSIWHDYNPEGMIFNRKIDFWKNFSSHNYFTEWAQVKVPVLALYGASDAHAIGPLDAELIAQTVNQHQENKATFQVIPNTNHLFANVPSKAQELKNINNGVSTQVAFTQFNLELPVLIDDWIKAKKKQGTKEKYELASRQFPKAATKMSSMDVLAADIDQDGQEDLIIATEFGPNQLFLYKNGKWEARELPQLKAYTPPYLGEDSEDIAIADFDKDGDLDLFFVSEDTKDHELLWNDGQGNFSFPDFQISKKGQANAVLVYDFNQDGWQDILIGIRGQNELYINQEGKGFIDETATYWIDNEDHTQDLILVDIDGDRDLDILEGIEEGNNNLYLNEKG
ncbi:MAG: alpha/beta fold hydrolase, partial [Bacteroidota bacterium]